MILHRGLCRYCRAQLVNCGCRRDKDHALLGVECLTCRDLKAIMARQEGVCKVLGK